MLLLLLFVLFLGGVSGAETEETMTVMEGDSVTLQTNLTEVLNDDTILWLYGPKDSVISQITRKHDLTSFFVTGDERFRGRLQVDQKTGSLTIRNTRIKHSGQYKLSTSRQKSTTEIFNVTVSGMVGEMDGVKSVSVSVMEGESVTLQNDVSGVQRDDLIVWRFGDKGTLLAKMDVETNENSLSDADVRFRDRLKLDHQTGSLTIKNTRTEHSGLYEVQIRGSETSQRFLLSVTAVPGSGLSPGGIAGIIVAALLLAVVVSSVVIYYRRKISELEKQVETTAVKVPDGKFVTLMTETNLQEDDTVKWWYHDNDNLIAEINQNDKKVYDGFEERFRSKLKLDEKTGNLSINNTMTIHTGLYILEISSKTRIIHKKFVLTVTMETVEVKEGDSVPLMIDTDIQPDDVILWTFGPENSLVVKADPGMTVGGRFRDRVLLDGTTGSLTITNISNTDSGHYKIQIINNRQTTFRRFNVIVTEEQHDSVTVRMSLLNKKEEVIE